jgi:hypothetical protein
MGKAMTGEPGKGVRKAEPEKASRKRKRKRNSRAAAPGCETYNVKCPLR